MCLWDTTLGTMNQMREYLQARYQGDRVVIPQPDGAKIDCMFIKANTYNRFLDEFQLPLTDYLPQGIDDDSTIQDNPTVILCNPNGLCYEYMYLTECNTWLQYYLNCGCNVIMWNYRGFGNSTGKACPSNILTDAESVLDYVRNNLGVKKVGVHGYSMGGLAASHLAKKKNLDFLVADRTFSSLTRVADTVPGKVLYYLYSWTTGWDNDSADAFLKAKCYKILIFDARDVAIPLVSSLKYDISRKIIERALGVKQSNGPLLDFRQFTYRNWRSYWVLLLKMKKELEIRVNRLINQSKVDDYSKLMNKKQLTDLHASLKRIFEIRVASLQKPMPCCPFCMPKQDGNMTIQLSMPSPRIAEDYANLDAANDKNLGCTATDRPISSMMLRPEGEKTPEPEEKKAEEKKTDELNNTTSDYNEKFLQAAQQNPVNPSSEENSKFFKGVPPATPTAAAKTSLAAKEKTYLKMITEEKKEEETFKDFMNKLTILLNFMEAGGVTLMDIFGNGWFDSKNFREFVKSLEIWGSYKPIPNISALQVRDIKYHHNQTAILINEFLNKIAEFIEENKHYASDTLEAKLLTDVIEIREIFNCIYGNLQTIQIVKMTEPLSSRPEEVDAMKKEVSEIHIEENSNASIESSAHKKLTEPDTKVDVDIVHQLSTFANIGYLVPVRCGHNGRLNIPERALFNYYVNKSGLLESGNDN
jgi:pimeloyl-ACP methyl ester carboxylesterase